MRTAQWSINAQLQFLNWFSSFAEADERLADEAATLIRARADQLGRLPFTGRPSRWPGLREASLPRWRKLLVYQVKRTEVVVVAFYDTRQDLSVVSPRPE